MFSKKLEEKVNKYTAAGWIIEKVEEDDTTQDVKLTKTTKRAIRNPFGAVTEYADIESAICVSEYKSDNTIEVVTMY